MSDLESQFEQAFTEIPLDSSGRNLLDADAVTECVIQGEKVTITLQLPPDTAQRHKIRGLVESRVTQISGISTVTIRMADERLGANAGTAHASHPTPSGSQPREPQRPTRQVFLDNYDGVIAVASGKGGVGKSTVAVNLAVTLSRMGHKVSLFDVDIYGPSLPIMMGVRNTRPTIDGERIQPLKKYGVDLLSIGNLIDEGSATIWRGPMVHQVIEQLMRDTDWPGGDFMILDLPPGTGDAQLSISQLCEVAGAVIVSTPQDVALLDAVKGVAMFQKVDIPIIGLIENMSTFVCPHCGVDTPIFNTGSAEKASGQYNVPFLGRIPLELAIREGGDAGIPVASKGDDSASAKAFTKVTESMMKALETLG